MNFKTIYRNIAAVATATAIAAGLGACHSIESWDNDYYGNFDALWTILDEHYCFFESKDIDWKAIGQRYRAEIDTEWDNKTYFFHLAAMLDELRDGHTNLISWFNVSYYRKWWSDYPQNFNLRLIQEHYLDFDYYSGSGVIYKILEDRNVGYMYYGSFSQSFGDSFIDEMLYSMRETDGLIIDVRDNGGGDMTNVERLVSRFLDKRICAGYISHKTGPGHSDFSKPYAYYYDPAQNHVRWLKPVIVLTNRSTFSAANNFVSVMKSLPHVAVIGDITGGGSGMPFSSEIPCGWAVRFSASPVYDAEMNLTEHGVEPSPGGEIDMDPEREADGIDTILEFAIEVLNRAAADKGTPSQKLAAI